MKKIEARGIKKRGIAVRACLAENTAAFPTMLYFLVRLGPKAIKMNEFHTCRRSKIENFT
jgi:hypothetical protein